MQNVQYLERLWIKQISTQDLRVWGVKVNEIVDDMSPVRKVYDPQNPESNDEGFVFLSNVNEVTEMVEMVAASRSFQNNVEVVSTAKQLMFRTLDIVKA